MWRELTIQRLMLIILFTSIFVMAVRVPVDTDTWWHIRSGEYIIDQREIPKTDPFSHTRYGEDWIDHSWGSQLVIYGAYHLFGGHGEPGDSGNIGLSLYTAVLATVGIAFVYGMCAGNVYTRAFVIVWAAATAAVFWSPRPQMFSFMLGALVLYLLHLYKRQKIDYLWAIPAVMLLWANLHGGFAIGFIFMFGSIVGEILGNLLDRDSQSVVRWSRLRKMGLVTAVSILAIIVNPYGIQMLGYPFRTVGIGALQDYIQEWASPNFHQTQAWPFAILIFATLAAVGLGSRRIDWTDLVLVCGTGLMALMAGRNIAVFAITATPVLSRHLDSWLTERGWQIHPMRRARGARLAINWILLVMILFAGLAKIAVALNEKTMREGQEKYLPVEIAAYLDKTPPEGKMFNSYNWGGYLMFAAPDVPVYVDGRTDLYDDAFLRDYLDVTMTRDGWEEALDDIGFVVIESNSLLAMTLRRSDAWHEQQFDDGRSSLFTRVDES